MLYSIKKICMCIYIYIYIIYIFYITYIIFILYICIIIYLCWQQSSYKFKIKLFIQAKDTDLTFQNRDHYVTFFKDLFFSNVS